MEKIADVLARRYPQFNRVVPDCLISDALYQMCSENVDFLIVLDQNNFAGIITDHDIASRILFENRPLNQISVHEFMNKSIPVVTPETSLEQGMQLMERHNLRHLAVFDRFTFKGVVSSYDLMHEALNSRKGVLEEETHQRKGYPWNY